MSGCSSKKPGSRGKSKSHVADVCVLGVGGGGRDGAGGAVQRVCVYSEYLYCRFLHVSMCVSEGEGGGSSLSTFLSACECVFGTV